MTVAVHLESALRPLLRGPLPVRLHAWDGSLAGPLDAPRVVLESPRALRRILWRPGELGAAQAYVTGELDVEGEVTEALSTAWRTVAERRFRACACAMCCAWPWPLRGSARSAHPCPHPPPRPGCAAAATCGSVIEP